MAEVNYDSTSSALAGFEEEVPAGDEEQALANVSQQYAGIVRTESGVVVGALSAQGQASLANDATQMAVFSEAIGDHSADNEESSALADNNDPDADRGKILRAACTLLLVFGGLVVAIGIPVGGYFGIVALRKAKNSADENSTEAAAAPTAAPQEVAVRQDTPTAITLTATDMQQRPISFDFNQPSHGVVSGTAPSVIYTPASGYVGDDSFTFTATAGGNTSDPAPVTLKVEAKSSTPPITPPRPSANLQRLETQVNQAIEVLLTGVPGGKGALTFAVTRQPVHGSLTGSAPKLIYTPQTDFEGADQFQFTVAEGGLVSDPSTIHITVNPPADTSGENSKWFKAVNDPVGTEQELIDANKKLRGLNDEQFWNTYWQAVVEPGSSISMQARLAKHVADAMPIVRNYGADFSARVSRKKELLAFGRQVAAQMLVGYDGVKKTVLKTSVKTGYDTVRALSYQTGVVGEDVSRRFKLWVLAYALDQVAIQQGHGVLPVYNAYLSPNSNLTEAVRLEKVLDPLNGTVFFFLKPSSLDIDRVVWSVDQGAPTDVVPLYFIFRLDTTTLSKGQHSLEFRVEFDKTSGKAALSNSVVFDVDNT